MQSRDGLTDSRKSYLTITMTLIDNPPMNERNVDLFIINLWGKFYMKRSTKKIRKNSANICSLIKSFNVKS